MQLKKFEIFQKGKIRSINKLKVMTAGEPNKLQLE